jgi:three-Cys-motif partner protein
MELEGKPIRPWSKDKLDLLGKYLHAYSVIMNSAKKNWLRSYSYIDAFAGVGRHPDPETQSYVDGSPLVALKCVPPFDDFWFIERMAGRLVKLRKRVAADYAAQVVQFRTSDANAVLRDEVAQQIQRSKNTRGFVFLDPYGLEVDFSTVRALGQNGAFDVFVNFSVMGITRLLERGRLPDAQARSTLARVMDDTRWVDSLYDEQASLFGDSQMLRGRFDPDSCANAYLAKVKDVFPFVSEPVPMRNSKDSVLYVLFLASHNHTAVKITNEIFKKYERERAQPRLM